MIWFYFAIFKQSVISISCYWLTFLIYASVLANLVTKMNEW